MTTTNCNIECNPLASVRATWKFDVLNDIENDNIRKNGKSMEKQKLLSKYYL